MFVVRAKVTFDENFEKQAVRLVALKLTNTPRSGHHALEGADNDPFFGGVCHPQLPYPLQAASAARHCRTIKIADFMSLHGAVVPADQGMLEPHIRHF